MDEFSYYSTVVSIITIQLAFYWLFRYDSRKDKLLPVSIESQRLAVVLASNRLAASGNFEELMRRRLEALGFIVFQVIHRDQLEPAAAIIATPTPTPAATSDRLAAKRNRVLLLDSSRSFQFLRNSFNDFLEIGAGKWSRDEGEAEKEEAKDEDEEVQEEPVKLHAYVNLIACDTRDGRRENGQSADSNLELYVRRSIIGPLKVLLSISEITKRDKTRIIHLSEDKLLPNQSSSAGSSMGLAEFIYQAIVVKLSQCGHQFVLPASGEKVDCKTNGLINLWFLDYPSRFLQLVAEKLSHVWSLLGTGKKAARVGVNNYWASQQHFDSLAAEQLARDLEEKIMRLYPIEEDPIGDQSLIFRQRVREL